MRYINSLIVYLILFAFLSCKNDKKQNSLNSHENIKRLSVSPTQEVQKVDSVEVKDNFELSGYDELANENNYNGFTVSEYNTDLERIPNIERPHKSQIRNFKFSKEKLFGIWVQDPGSETPHATFSISEESFLVVDYDGDGNMPYEIQNDSIIIYYNDFIKKGRIIDVDISEQLLIHWNGIKNPTIYYTWKN